MKFKMGIIILGTLFCWQLSNTSQMNFSNRTPASLEQRISPEEIAANKETPEKIKKLEEKIKLLMQMKGELAQLEMQNASLQQGALDLQMYTSGPLASLSESNDGLAKYMQLVEQNKPYAQADFQGIMYGEVQSPMESFYFGLPLAKRTIETSELESSIYYSMAPLNSSMLNLN